MAQFHDYEFTPGVDAVVQETMFFSAIRKSSKVKFDAAASNCCVAPPPVPDEDTDPEDAAIWSWQHDPGELNKFKNVFCRQRGMHWHNSEVLREISWSDPIVVFKPHLGRSEKISAPLPLTKDFLIKRGVLESGAIEPTKLWPLEAKLDTSCILIFGYRFHYPTGKWKPLKDCTPKDFDGSLCRSIRVTRNGTTKYQVDMKIIVSLMLMCGKERDDWEPFGAMGAGRIWPLLMLLPSQKLEHVDSQVEVLRPEKTTMDMHPDFMSNQISAVLVADTNLNRTGTDYTPDWMPTQFVSPTPPVWEHLFDYVDTKPAAGKRFTVVDPRTESEQIKDAAFGMKISSLADMLEDKVPRSPGIYYVPLSQTKKIEAFARRVASMPEDPESMDADIHDAIYESLEIDRVARQGAFDNIHLAPKMRVKKTDDFDLTMAPICAHDCLHAHWRWGSCYGSSKKSLLGWDEQFNPYSTVGAPMVAHNQKIDIELIGGHGFKYIAEIDGSIEGGELAAGRWQVVMHHGMGMALSIDGYVADALFAFLRGLGYAKEWKWLPEVELYAHVYALLQRQSWSMTAGGPRKSIPRLYVKKTKWSALTGG